MKQQARISNYIDYEQVRKEFDSKFSYRLIMDCLEMTEQMGVKEAFNWYCWNIGAWRKEYIRFGYPEESYYRCLKARFYTIYEELYEGRRPNNKK